VVLIHQRHRQTDGQTDRQTTTCDRKTRLKLARTLMSRWKEEELEDKIYGEQRMFTGEMKFPEFMFKPSQLTFSVSLYCDTAGLASGFGYTVLQRAVCVPCLPGTFFDPLTGNCTRCPLNTYQDQLAARSCTRCHVNYYTRRRGMYVSCTECGKKYPAPKVVCHFSIAQQRLNRDSLFAPLNS